MAIICESVLRISGSFTELDRFSEQASGPDCCLDANQFAPYPKIFDILDKLNPSDLTCYRDNMSDEEIGILTLARLNGLDITKSGYNQGGSEWCESNWGFRTNIPTCYKSWNKRTIIYSFHTEWTPPIKLVIAMGEQFPKLFFMLSYRSFESLNGILKITSFLNGTLKITGGKIIEKR